jgi:hypothetical protein
MTNRIDFFNEDIGEEITFRIPDGAVSALIEIRSPTMRSCAGYVRELRDGGGAALWIDLGLVGINGYGKLSLKFADHGFVPGNFLQLSMSPRPVGASITFEKAT